MAMFSIKKMRERIKGYADNYMKEHVIRKSVSLLVVVCFIVNIANLPAYAGDSNKSLYEKKKQQQEMAEEGASQGVSYTDRQNYYNPNAALEDNRMRSMSEGVEGALLENGEAVGSITDGEITTKKLGDSASKKDESRTNLLEKKIGKAAEAEGLGKYNDSEQAGQKSFIKKEIGTGQYNQLIEKVSKATGFKAKTVEAVMKRLASRADGMTAKEEKEGKGIAERVKSIFGKEIGDKADGEGAISQTEQTKQDETKPEGYEEVVKELSKQSGVSEEEINKQLEGIDKNILEEAIALLSKLFAQGGEIINCATAVLAEVINGVSKGVLALQALLVDIATGAFVSNNKANIESGSNQLMTSMEAMSRVLESYGKEAVGYAVDMEGFLSGLKEGESGIVWVNEDHYITVTKLADGKYSLTDSNVNEGKAVVLDAEAIKLVLSGRNAEGKDENGNVISVTGYNAVMEDGKVRVLTESEGVGKAEGAEVISSEKMKEIAGAKTEYKEVTTIKTIEKTKIVEMIGHRQEPRSREVSGTKSVKNSDGTYSYEHYSYTIHYTVTVEFTYEIEVKYTEEIEVKEKIAVEVPDNDDPAKKAAAEEAAKKAWEDKIAKMKQDEFEKQMKEGALRTSIKSSTEEEETTKANEAAAAKVEELENMSNEDFEAAVGSDEHITVNKTEITEIKDENGKSIIDADSLANLNNAINNGSTTVDQAVQDLGTAASIKNKIDNSTVSVNESGTVQLNVPTPGQDNTTTVNVADIENPSTFVQGYKNAQKMTGDISGANASYSVNGGWSVSVPTPGSTTTPPQTTTVAVNNMSAKETSSFINGYNNAVSMTGAIPGSTAVYNPSEGWQVTTSVPGSNPPQTTTVNVNEMSKNQVKNWISDYNDAKKIADETGLETNYDDENGWQIIYNNGTEDKTINVSDFNDVDIFITNYKKAADIAAQTGMGINFDAENHRWQVTYNNGTEEKAINVSSINDTESFIEGYNKAKTISDGTDMGLNYSSGNWYVTYNDGKDSIRVSGIEDPQTFIQQYNDAKKIAEETGEAFTLNYNSNKGWNISYYDGQRNVSINMSDIQDVDQFITDYNKVAAINTDGKAKLSYDSETGIWTAKSGNDTVNADQINIKDDGTVLITMDDGVTINGSYFGMYNDLKKYAEDNEYALSFTSESGLLIIKDSEGQILFDASNPITYTGGDPLGTAGEHTTTDTEIPDVNSTITIGDLSLADIKGYVSLKVSGADNEALTNYLISKNGFTERTVTDSEGNVLYVDKPVVDTVGSGRTGVFERTYYENGVAVTTKLIIEGYSKDYSGITTQQTFAKGEAGSQTITLADGTKFTTDYAIVLEKVAGYTYNKDGSVTESFVLFDAEGYPWCVQTGTYGIDGKYTRSTEVLSLYIPRDALGKQSGGSSGGGDNPLQVYRDLLSGMGSQQVKKVGKKDYTGYKGFKYFKQGMINLAKCLGNDGSNATIQVTVKVDGRNTTVTVVIPNFEFSNDFSTTNAYYQLGDGSTYVRGEFGQEITFSTKEGVQIPEDYQYFSDTATNTYHTQQVDANGETHETVINNVQVDLTTGQISYTNGVSTVNQDGVTALLKNSDPESGVYVAIAEIVKGAVNALVGKGTEIAQWILDVVQGAWSYGTGLLATSAGITFDSTTGLFIKDTEVIAQAIQEQINRLALMSDTTASESAKQTALEEFYDNLPQNYKDYLDSLGITADQIKITEEGLYIAGVVDPSGINLPSELNGCALTGEIAEGTKLDLLFTFEGEAFVRTPEVYSLESSGNIETNFTGYIDIGIVISASGGIEQTGLINFVATNSDAKYADSAVETSSDNPDTLQTTTDEEGTAQQQSEQARQVYTHGTVIQSGSATTISMGADGKLVLTFLSSTDGTYQAAFMGVGAEYTEGSYLTGIGEVTEGTLTIIGQTASGYQFASAGETCVVEQKGVTNEYGATVDIKTTYNVYGISQIVTTNSQTNSTLINNYIWTNGQLTGVETNLVVKTGFTAEMPFDTGLGYIVDSKMWYQNEVILQIAEDGTAYLTNGAVVSQRIASNDNGDGIYVVYTGKGIWNPTGSIEQYIYDVSKNVGLWQDMAAVSTYELRQGETVTQLQVAQTADGNSLYGLQNGQVIKVVFDGNGSFSVTNPSGFTYNEETKTYTGLEEGAISRQNINITVQEDGSISLSMELLALKIGDTFYNVGEKVSIPGMEGEYTLGTTEKDGVQRWIISPVVTADDSGLIVWQGPTVSLTLSDGNTTNIVLKEPLILGFNNGQMFFELKEDNSFYYNGVAVSLAAGSILMMSEKNGLVIIDGKLKISDNAIEIPKAIEQETQTDDNSQQEEGAENEYPEAYGTNAVIVENENGGYTVSNGTIQITNGSLVVMGIGATFKTGSFVAGQTVKYGSIEIVGTRDVNGQTMPIFVAADGVYARTDMGGVTVKYNGNGVYSARIVTGTRTVNEVNSSGGLSQNTYTTFRIYDTENYDGYRVLAYDANGNLKYHTKTSLTTSTELLTKTEYEYYSSVNAMLANGTYTVDQVSNWTYYKTCVAKVAGISESNITALGYTDLNDFISQSTLTVNDDGTYSLSATQAMTQEYLDFINTSISSQGQQITSIPQVMQVTTVINYNLSTTEATVSQQITGMWDKPYTMVDGSQGTFTGGVLAYAQDANGNMQYGYMFNVSLTFKSNVDDEGILTFSNELYMADMDFVYSGSFATQDPPAGASSDSSEIPPTVYSQGVYDQTKDGYTTVSSRAGEYAVISMRNGQYCAVGEGAVAFDGSQLRSAFGLTTLSGGNALYSGGSWAGFNGASFTFNSSPSEIKANFTDAFKKSGISITGLENIDFSKPMGTISTDIMAMTESILAAQSYSVRTAGINATVIGYEDENGDVIDTFTLPDGVSLQKGASFNISLVSTTIYGTVEQFMAIKANNDGIKANYTTPDGWTSEDGLSSFEAIFNKGEYISFGSLLNKNGITTLVGTDIKWNGETIAEVTVELKTRGYFGAYWYELVGNGETVNDPVSEQPFEKTNLVGSYKGTNFTILEGARVNISAGGISVLKANVYTENMYIDGLSASDDEPSQEEQDNQTKKEIESYFSGSVGADSKVTGIFYNYSDATMAQVFSAATVLNVGSTYKAGSVINGQTLDYDCVMTKNGLELTESAKVLYMQDQLESIAKTAGEIVGAENVKVLEDGIEVNGVKYDLESIQNGELEKMLTKEMEAQAIKDQLPSIAETAGAIVGSENVEILEDGIKVNGVKYTFEDIQSGKLTEALKQVQLESVAKTAGEIVGTENVQVLEDGIQINGIKYSLEDIQNGTVQTALNNEIARQEEDARAQAAAEAQAKYDAMSDWDKFWYDVGDWFVDVGTAVGDVFVSAYETVEDIVVDVVNIVVDVVVDVVDIVIDVLDFVVVDLIVDAGRALFDPNYTWADYGADLVYGLEDIGVSATRLLTNVAANITNLAVNIGLNIAQIGCSVAEFACGIVGADSAVEACRNAKTICGYAQISATTNVSAFFDCLSNWNEYEDVGIWQGVADKYQAYFDEAIASGDESAAEFWANRLTDVTSEPDVIKDVTTKLEILVGSDSEIIAGIKAKENTDSTQNNGILDGEIRGRDEAFVEKLLRKAEDGNILGFEGVTDKWNKFGGTDTLVNLDSDLAAKLYEGLGEDVYKILGTAMFGENASLTNLQSQEFVEAMTAFTEHARTGILDNRNTAASNLEVVNNTDYNTLLNGVENYRQTAMSFVANNWTEGNTDGSLLTAIFNMTNSNGDSSIDYQTFVSQFQENPDQYLNNLSDSQLASLASTIITTKYQATPTEGDSSLSLYYQNNSDLEGAESFVINVNKLNQYNSDVLAAQTDYETWSYALEKISSDLAVLGYAQTTLASNSTYTISVDLGAICTWIPVAVSSNLNGALPNQTYYKTIILTPEQVFTENEDGTQSVQYNDDGTIKYNVVESYSITTADGVSISDDGNSYKAYGVQGTYTDTNSKGETFTSNVCWQYTVTFAEGAGMIANIGTTANIILADNNAVAYQQKSAGEIKDGEEKTEQPETQTKAVIIETADEYKATGAGNRVTVTLGDDGSWNAIVFGKGTVALEGSTIGMTTSDVNGQTVSAYIDIELGAMTYNGSYWGASSGFTYKFSNSNDEATVRNFVSALIETSLATKDENGNIISLPEKVVVPSEIDLFNVTMFGNPYSAVDTVRSIGACYVYVNEGYVIDASKYGDIYKATIGNETMLVLNANWTGSQFGLTYTATEDTSAVMKLEDGFAFGYEGTQSTSACIFAKGQEICLGTMLWNMLGEQQQVYNQLAMETYNTEWYNLSSQEQAALIDNIMATGDTLINPAAVIHNTQDVTIQTGTRTDENNNIVPVYETFKAGELVFTGNKTGDLVLANNLYINITEDGWSRGNKNGNDKAIACFAAGSVVDLTKNNEDGSFSAVITGAVIVKDLTLPESPDNDENNTENSSGDSSNNPYFYGYVGENRTATGIFYNCSSESLTTETLATALYAAGSILSTGSILSDGTTAKYGMKVKEDGSYDAIGATGWQKFSETVVGVVEYIGYLSFNFLNPVGLALNIVNWISGGTAFDGAFDKVQKEARAHIYNNLYHVTGNNANNEYVQKHMKDLGVSVLVATAAAIASVVITIASFGTLAAAVGVAWAIVGSVIGGTLSAIAAAQSAFKAVQCAQQGDWAGFAINTLMTVVSVLGTKGLNAAIGNFGAKLTAQIFGKKLVEKFGETVLGTVGKEVLAQAANAGAKTGLIETIKGAFNFAAKAKAAGMSTAKYILTSSWAVRGYILGSSSAVDLGSSLFGWEGEFINFSRIFSLQGMVGWSEISADSIWNSNLFGIEGLKVSSLLWVVGYVAAPGMISRGLRTAIIGNQIKSVSTAGLTGKELEAANARIDALKAARTEYGFGGFISNNSGVFADSVSKGAKQSISNIGQLFGRGVDAAGLASAGSRWQVALNAWGGIATNTYRMAILNIGMNAVGKGVRSLGILDAVSDTSAVGGLLNFVFADMGSSDNIFEINLANSAMFGSVMYIAMPFVAGFANGIKGQFFTSSEKLAEQAAESVANQTASMQTKSVIEQALNAPKNLATSIWEEGFKENVVQALVTPLVGANAAEYISEFAFPDGDINILSNYMQTVQTANYTNQTSINRAAQSIQTVFNNAGYTDVTVSVVSQADGTYGISIANVNGEILSRGFASRTDMQNFMMGVYNAVGSVKGADLSVSATRSVFASVIETNIETVQDVRTQAKAPGLWQAFVNGDTRTSSDMIEPIMSAASVIQQYGVKTKDGFYKFDTTKFTEQIKEVKTVAELNTMLKQVIIAAMISQQGIGQDGFFTGSDLTDVVASVDTIENITQQQLNMQIAQFGAMLKNTGLAANKNGMLNTVVNKLSGLKLSDFGIETFSQLQELNAYVEIMQSAGVQLSVSNEIKEIRDNIAGIEAELKGKTFEEQQKIVQAKLKTLQDRQTELQNAKDALAAARTMMDSAGAMASLDSSYEFALSQAQSRVNAAAKEALTQFETIMLDYLNNSSANIEGEIQREQIKSQIKQLTGYKKSAISKALSNIDNLSLTAISVLQASGFDFTNIKMLTGSTGVLDVVSASVLKAKIETLSGDVSIIDMDTIQNGVSDANSASVNNLIVRETLTIQDLITIGVLSVNNMNKVTFTEKGLILSFEYSGKTYEIKFSRAGVNELNNSSATREYAEKIIALEKAAKEIELPRLNEELNNAKRELASLQNEQSEAESIRKLQEKILNLETTISLATGTNSSAISVEKAKAGGSEAFGEVIELSAKGEIKGAQAKMTEVFREMAEKYWDNFDEAIVSVFGNQAEAIDFIKKGIANKHSSKWQEIRKAMEDTITKGNSEYKLTYQDQLALHLKFLELQLIANGADIITIGKEYDSAKFIVDGKGDFAGYGALTLKQSTGKSTIDQALLVIQNHFGNISAVQAGGGKSLANDMAFGMYFDMYTDAHIAEYMGAGTNDTTQFVKSDDNAVMQALLGIEFVDGSELYSKKDFNAIMQKYNSTGRTVIAFALSDRAFVEVEAVKNKGLYDSLNNVAMRVFDEADVAALSTQSFINSSGGTPVEKAQVDKIKGIYETIKNTVKAVAQTNTSLELTGLQFKYDNNSIIVSDELKKALQENGIDITSKGEEAIIASQIMRAMFVMQAQSEGAELITFDEQGQPGTTSSGKQSPGTKDQMTSYNVALAIIAHESGSKKYDNVNPYNITISESSAEAIISSIARHHREGQLALNAASSATMQDAAPISEVIYGGKVITISSSDMKTVLKQLGFEEEASSLQIEKFLEKINKGIDSWGNESRVIAGTLTSKADIISQGIATAIDFFTGKSNCEAGLLFGAMDMSYNAEVMIETLAQLYQQQGGDINKFKEDVKEYSKTASLSQTLGYIAQSYQELKSYVGVYNSQTGLCEGGKIQVVDAKIANENPEYVTEIVAAQAKGKLTFSNVSGLRGVNYKNINMIILDGQNFTSSDLYQAIGRAGRNSDWGKDKTRVAIMMEAVSIENTLIEIKKISRYMQKQGQQLFTDRRGQELLAKLNSNRNLTKIEQLELVSSYKSRQTQSSSILFKAHQEISGILIKNPIVNMIRYANEKGLTDEVARLEGIYARVLAHNESNIFAQNSDNASEYVDALTKLEESFMQELVQAKEIFEIIKQSKDGYIRGQAEKFMAKIQEFNSAETPFEAKRNADKVINNEATFVGVNSDIVFDSENPITDLANVLVGLSGNLLPTNSSMAELTQAVSNETVQQEFGMKDGKVDTTSEQFKQAKQQGLVVEKDGKYYITQVGQNYAKLIENNANVKSNNFAAALGILLQLLLGGNIQPPEDEKELMLSVAKALQTVGITNVDSFNNLINDTISDTSVLKRITNITQLKNIINATYPYGLKGQFKDKYLYTAQYIALMKTISEENEIVTEYEKLVTTKAQQQYGLTAGEKAQALKDKIHSNPVLEALVVMPAGLIGGILSFLPKLLLINIFSNILPGKNDVLYETAVGQQIANPLNSVGSVMATDIMMSQNKSKQNLSAVDMILVAVFGIGNFINNVKLGISLRNSVKKLDRLSNPSLSEVASLSNEELKAKMAMAGIEITEKTDTAIENMRQVLSGVSQAVSERLGKEMRLSDINKFINMTSAVNIEDSQERLSKASYQTIADMLKFTKAQSAASKTISAMKKKISEKSMTELQKQGAMLEDMLKENQKIEERAKQAKMKFFETDPYSQIEKVQDMKLTDIINYAEYSAQSTGRSLEEELKMALATLYPAKDPNEMLKRLNGIKDDKYAKYAKASDLVKDKNFTEEGKATEEYEKALETATTEQEQTKQEQMEQEQAGKVIEVGEIFGLVGNSIGAITEGVNRLIQGKYTEGEIKEMLVRNCAVAAAGSINKLTVEGMINFVVEMVTGKTSREMEGLDELKVAGEGNEVSLGSLKDLTGYEYAMVGNRESITEPVIAYFEKGHVATVKSKEDIEKIEQEGYKFTGIVLADKATISKTADMYEEVLLNRIYGVMKAGEREEIIEYLVAAFKGEGKADAMREYIGATGTGDEEISQAVMDKIEEVIKLGAEGKVDKVIAEAEIKILTGIREILMTTNKLEEGDKWLETATESEIISKIEENRKVNQSVIIKSISSGKSGEDFVINVAKLQKIVAEEGIKTKMLEQMSELMKKGKTDLGAIMDIQGKEDLKTPMSLFKMSDIKAVAAAA